MLAKHGAGPSSKRPQNCHTLSTKTAGYTDCLLWRSEASRRYEWNGRWTGGVHDGVEEEADKRMADVERWNGEIEELE